MFVAGQVGDLALHGVSLETAALDAVELPHVRSRRGARANVLQFAVRRPGSGVSPVEALRRTRIVSVVSVLLASLAAVTVAMTFGQPVLLVAVACWLAVELVVVSRWHHVDEVADLAGALRRQAQLAMAVCVGGVLLRDPDLALRALGIIGVLAALHLISVVALRWTPTRRVVGLATPPTVLVVADRVSAMQVVEDRAGLTSSRVVGVCLVEESDRVSSVAGVPVLGDISDVLSLVEDLRIHEVTVRLEPPLDDEWLRSLQWALEEHGARLTLVTKLRHTAARRVRVRSVGSSIVMGVAQARPIGLARHVKAALEAALAFGCFVLALPVLLLCAVAVKLDSHGPAFFLQTRVRDGDRTFTMFKLRTMSVDAEARRAELEQDNEVGGGLFKMQADPRVTRVGRVLRKLSLDELPQLLNVMRGEMSLIGPRPALPSEVAEYDDRARRRLGVKPGLTGLWQVSGRSTLSWEESVALDIDYVDNWSPGRDVRIALETVRAVVAKDGAY